MGLSFISRNPATEAYRSAQEADRSQRLNDMRMEQARSELDYNQEQRANARASDTALRGWAAEQGRAPVPAAPNIRVSALPETPATGLRTVGRSYPEMVAEAENGTGNPAARNLNSSATGDGQFIESTWLETLRKHAPGVVETAVGPNADINNQDTRQTLLDLRRDPQLSRTMIGAHGDDNRAALASRGLRSDDAATYLAHFVGLGGASAILSANPNMPIERVLSPEAVAANPFLQGKTAGQVVSWAEGKMGGGTAQPAIGAVPAQSATGLRATPMQRTAGDLRMGAAQALARVPGAGGRAMELLLAGATEQEKLGLQVIQMAERSPDLAISYAQQMGIPLPPHGEEALRNRATRQQMMQTLEEQIKRKHLEKPAVTPSFSLYSGTGPEGQTGAYTFDTHSGKAEFQPGINVTGRAGGAAGGGSTVEIVKELMREDPKLTYAQALQLAKNPANASRVEMTKERLALAAFKADPNQYADPEGTLNKWRGYYGVGGDDGEEAPTSRIQAPSAGGRPGATPPPEVVARLREGYDTTLGNGQVWTKQNGQPVRVK